MALGDSNTVADVISKAFSRQAGSPNNGNVDQTKLEQRLNTLAELLVAMAKGNAVDVEKLFQKINAKGDPAPAEEPRLPPIPTLPKPEPVPEPAAKTRPTKKPAPVNLDPAKDSPRPPVASPTLPKPTSPQPPRSKVTDLIKKLGSTSD